ncbi:MULTISPECIES: hypothetical protein [unclassified Corynebacterium]|uniref:hypothetical protein n=1 Tax=unclassified Corynebacterium TaxID=2624378 RepID=UPI0029CA6ECE|nr:MULTISPECIES: hypothetical protein [unclassified Corynebacterium]WPF66833.1 hypothetical protein OLX12_03670 [Corynebacterium sp. 22KM0430]WPF69321.1 hypothetical protein OLW90_03665 [Corynebacterium sp. 21KM1197]
MYRSFLSSRRVYTALALSTVACVLLLLLFPTSYGIYGANGIRDTPLTRLLPVVLGALAASTVHPVAPAMEATAPTRLLRIRALSLAGIMLTQFLLLLVSMAAVQASVGIGLMARDVAIYLSATALWQGLCCLSVAFSSRMAAWAPPLGVLLFLLLYSWKDSEHPVPWNMLLTINPFTIALSVIFLFGALIALGAVDTARWDG